MSIDTEAKRKSAGGLKPFKKVLIPDGTIEAADRVQIACLYSGIAIALPPAPPVVWEPRDLVDFTGRNVSDFTGRNLVDFSGRDLQ